jgi:hypothetical protein
MHNNGLKKSTDKNRFIRFFPKSVVVVCRKKDNNGLRRELSRTIAPVPGTGEESNL